MSAKQLGRGFVTAVLCAVAWTLLASPSVVRADDQPGEPKIPLSTFMRKKLDASGKILEGLCTDDMELVQKGAEQLKEVSKAERFRVSNDVMYRQFNKEFESLADELIKAAESKNADRVALKWMDTTMSCMDCHRFVRGMRIADQKPESAK